MTHTPDVAGLADRLHQLSVQQLALFEHLLDVLDTASSMPATVTVCADELRTGDRIQGDRPDVVNTVALRPAYAAGRRHVVVATRAGDGDLFTVQVPVDTAYRVRVPRPEPVWADDPFGTPNTVQHDPNGRRMTRDEYELREAAYETSTEVAAR